MVGVSVGNKTSFRRDCDMISPAEQQTSRAAVLIVRILTGISKKSLTTALLLYCSELTSFRRDCDGSFWLE